MQLLFNIAPTHPVLKSVSFFKQYYNLKIILPLFYPVKVFGMSNLFYFVSQTILFAGIAFLIVFLFYSVHEKEKKAVLKVMPAVIVLSALCIANYIGFFPNWAQVILISLSSAGVILVIVPFGNKKIDFNVPNNRFDERDSMFSRKELEEGTEKFDTYYRRKSENRQKDDLFRKEAGLLSPVSKFYNPLIFNAAASTFSVVDLLQPLVEKKSAIAKFKDVDRIELTQFIKNWVIKLGASDVGFTDLKFHHIYSHVGRGNEYNNEVDLNHKYAIAFTVEMNYDSLKYTPQGPIIMESAQQYFNAGSIAVQVAQFLRNAGYEARAHIDANYRVICPVVAQDAGLGTIGRMGLLLTPKLGPRVRIGVVSTDLELDVNKKPIDSTITNFCEICKKCAANCPSGAISSVSFRNEKNIDPWRIDHEKCFTYWCKAGTDCGRCVTVCPFSHPDNFIHNFIRWLIKRNAFNRWLALKLDNYFYRNKPQIQSLKKWKMFSKS